MTHEDIRARFDHSPPLSPEKRAALVPLRTLTRNLAETYASELPAGREQALALTKLEEALFWADAAITRHQDHTDTQGEAR